MRRNLHLLVPILAAAFVAAWPIRTVSAGDAASRGKKLELVLQYDFLPDQLKVADASGKKHDGAVQDGEIVYGRRKHAVKLDGKGMVAMTAVPDTLNPQSQAMTVGAFCQPSAPDGVVAAMGDKSNGFCLYLEAGVPQFAVRAQGELCKIAAREPVVLDQWVHLAGMIDAKGQLSLVVNGWPVATAQGKLIPQKPAKPFCAGADPGSPVGDYAAPLAWHGLLQDIRLYWGVAERNANRELWQDWADLPGCGCVKKP
jgi:hypothetical protein